MAPYVEIETLVEGKFDPPNIDRMDPGMSDTATNLRSASEITSLKKIETFDAGLNGMLPIWELRSRAYDCLLILIARGAIRVEICAHGEDADELRQCLPALKEFARSVHIGKKGQKSGRNSFSAMTRRRRLSMTHSNSNEKIGPLSSLLTDQASEVTIL